MRKGILVSGMLLAAISMGLGPALPAMAQCPPADLPPTVMWINHLDFLPGDPSVQTSFNAVR